MSTTIEKRNSEVMTMEEWHTEARRRFGDKARYWKFVCPACGFVQSGEIFEELTDLTRDEIVKYLAFSCVGRWLKDGTPRDAFAKDDGPCNYAGGGLIGLNPIAVSTPDGEVHRRFAFAEEAAV